MSVIEGPSIIAPKLKIWWVHLHCAFVIVSANTETGALALAVARAIDTGAVYDSDEDHLMGVIEPGREPQTFVALRLDD